jgi:threonine dehydrogenase-like Zn-dependent dehydrogenase
MKALKWYGPYDLRVEETEEPKLIKDTDALVRPIYTGICGTDMHVYKGYINIVPGDIIGHEFVGIVEKVGSKVRKFKEGDRVIVSCWIADGECWYCIKGFHTQCVNINIFGMGPLYGESYQGADAELVRVPYADTILIKIPDDLSFEKALMISDGLPASYAGVVEGGFNAGDSVGIVGCGPIGLLAGMCAQLLGASQVIAIDLAETRLKIAKELGMITIDASKQNVAEEVRNLTDGRGVDLAIDAAGGGDAPLLTAIEIVRRKGKISVIGFHVLDYSLPVGQLWLTEKRMSFSIGDPITYAPVLIELVRRNRLDPTRIYSHILSLDEAPRGFELVDKKKAIKAIIKIK